MIVELSVENLAIIEKAQITLGPGLTVLTGETGAGKSLLVDALDLVLGERADSDLVRTGAPRANVSVVMDLSTRTDLLRLATDAGLPVEDSALFIQREVFSEGRSQARIGGKMTPLATLKAVGQQLVDLHGQHAHQVLLDPERHLTYLDLWIGKPAIKLLVRIATVHSEATEARGKLAALQAGLRDREHRLDLLRFQVEEIESASPRTGELGELEGQLIRLKNGERLARAAFGALVKFKDGEGSAADMLGVGIKDIEDVARMDPELFAIVDQLRAALYSIEENVHDLRVYAEGIDSNDDLLEEIATRIDVLKRLRRKYGEDEGAILDFLAKAKEELATLQDSESSEATLVAALQKAEGELINLCADLSILRHDKADEFAQLVEKELHDLAMEKSIFQVRVGTKEPCGDGADKVEFFFSANAGEPPRPLSKIASGGEMSRVMLAIKTALAGKAGVPTLIFDEVDAGLGGRAAAVMGKKLEDLARHYQVVVITHLPQIASRATTHYRIEKSEENGRVTTKVVLLKEKDRVEEIARMLAGEEVTDSARKNAKEMLSGNRKASSAA